LDEDPTKIDYDAIKYLAGECNYGGRVTDDKDRRLMMTILQDYYNADMVNDENYRFTPDDFYKLPNNCDTHESFVNFFNQMPNITHP
jgi:dynein heavy chain